MHVERLWRYPVKSLGGEPLTETTLTPGGVPGDRTVHVAGARGPLTGRTKHGLLTLRAATAADGTPLVEGHRWDSAEARDLVRRHAGPDAELRGYTGPERFDITNLLVATDGQVAALGTDIRRLRPNLLLAGVPDGEEQTWRRKALRIGDALIGVMSPRERCVVTTIDPDTGAQDVEVVRRINRDYDGRIALNCWVIEPGHIAVGDPVTLEDTGARAADVGGWVVGAPYAPPPGSPSVT